MGCGFLPALAPTNSSARDAMRSFVAGIADYARSIDPDFLIIAQNGDELLTMTDSPTGPLAGDYIAAIDGLGREDLFYGYDEDNQPTSSESTDWMLSYLDRAEALGIEVLVIDYCWDPALIDASYARNDAHGFASFAAPSRMLDRIPSYPTQPANVNSDDIDYLSDVGNFLCLLNPWRFDTKVSLVDALAETSFDALIIDLESEDGVLNRDDVAKLKIKANGGRRLVLCYLSIGEAEDYRSYWDASWSVRPPEWLLDENPDWPGNYSVQFSHSQWQTIVYAMLDDILEAGFDGVYLDRVDAYEGFEN